MVYSVLLAANIRIEPQKAQKRETKDTKLFAFVTSSPFVPFVVQLYSLIEPQKAQKKKKEDTKFSLLCLLSPFVSFVVQFCSLIEP